MADTFYREPAEGGDIDNWHDYAMAQMRCGGVGGLSIEAYMTGAVLYLSAGFAHIDDGTVRGAVERTAATVVDYTGVTVGKWGAIELSVAAASVTITVSELADSVDGATIPASVKAAYDYAKNGYYLTATKRLVVVFFRSAAAVIARIVNCEDKRRGFKGIEICSYYNGSAHSEVYIAHRIVTHTAVWNMDTTVSIEVAHGIPALLLKVISISGFLCDQGGSYPIASCGIADNVGNVLASVYHQLSLVNIDNTAVLLARHTGGMFDEATFMSMDVYLDIAYQS
jgi:hypothetical protein